MFRDKRHSSSFTVLPTEAFLDSQNQKKTLILNNMRKSLTISAISLLSFMAFPLQGAVDYKVIKRMVLNQGSVELGEYYDATQDTFLGYNVCIDQIKKEWITVFPHPTREGSLANGHSFHHEDAELELSRMLDMVDEKIGGHYGYGYNSTKEIVSNILKMRSYAETETHALLWRTKGFIECVDKLMLSRIKATHFVSEIVLDGSERVVNEPVEDDSGSLTSYCSNGEGGVDLKKFSGSVRGDYEHNSGSDNKAGQVNPDVHTNIRLDKPGKRPGLSLSMSLTPIEQLGEYMEVKTGNDGMFVGLDGGTMCEIKSILEDLLAHADLAEKLRNHPSLVGSRKIHINLKIQLDKVSKYLVRLTEQIVNAASSGRLAQGAAEAKEAIFNFRTEDTDFAAMHEILTDVNGIIRYML